MSTSRLTLLSSLRPAVQASLDADDLTIRLSGDKSFDGQTVRCHSQVVAVALTSLINQNKLLPP
jgi:hypothetical protein